VEPFKISDASSYDAVAENFGHFTELVTRPLAETLVSLASLGGNAQVLDVGTGSGVVALVAGRRLDGSGSITGVDLSDGLLAEASRNVAAAGLSTPILLKRADAEALPFPDQSFDAVLCLFALLHFPNPGIALSEMHRVLKPGGKLVIGMGSAPPWSAIQGWTHRLGRLPDLIRLRTGRLLLAPAHLNSLVERHLRKPSDPEETHLARDRGARAPAAAKLVRAAGFNRIRTHWQGGHLVLNSAEEFWNLQRTFSSIARKRLREATPSQVAIVRRDLDADCRRVLSNRGKLVYHYAAFYVMGTR
jgi:ubiquinone/menaquinone biosynthesis C-methylase UbiE